MFTQLRSIRVSQMLALLMVAACFCWPARDAASMEPVRRQETTQESDPPAAEPVPQSVQEEPQIDENQPNRQEVFDIPMDMEEPLIVFDSVGGFRRRDPEGFEREPVLQIFADGRVVSGQNNPLLAHCEWQLSDNQLQELLQYIVNEQKFFEIGTETIKEKIAATGRPVAIMDAGTSVFHLNIPQGSHSVEAYAIGFVASTYPEVEELTRLHEIEKRLRRIGYRTALGTDEQAAAIMAAINAEFANEFPDLGNFDLAGLSTANRLADGTLRVSIDGGFTEADGTVRTFRGGYQRPSDDAEPDIEFRETTPAR